MVAREPVKKKVLDFDGNSDEVRGTLILCMEGCVNLCLTLSDQIWHCNAGRGMLLGSQTHCTV